MIFLNIQKDTAVSNLLLSFLCSIHKSGLVFKGHGGMANKNLFKIRALAWFSADGAGNIRFLPNSCSQEKLLDFLDESLVPDAWKRDGLGPIPLLHDRSLIIWSEFESYFRLQRIQPQEDEDLWFGVEELWKYRTEKPGYWLYNSLRADLENIVASPY